MKRGQTDERCVSVAASDGEPGIFVGRRPRHLRFPLSLILPFDGAVAAACVLGMFIGFFLYRH